ncbi:MAG TPA: hypothetical protein PLQ09_01050 [Prolixibacteraceae bacterium]|nr:hypothetical protein [Prolixibacteraceae bacterium]
MGNRWIKVNRELTNYEFYHKDSEKVHLWIHLLLKANHTGRNEVFGGKQIFVKPGQFTTGRKQIRIETGISESKIERVLKYFEETKQLIVQQTSSSNRLITIVNWNTLFNFEQRNEQQTNSKRTANEHTNRIENKKIEEGLLCDLRKFEGINVNYLQIAEAFIELFRKNICELGGNAKPLENPKASCYYDIKELVETDQYSTQQLEAVFAFLQVNLFWQKIIIDTRTLRKNFNKIIIHTNKHGKTKESTSAKNGRLTTAIDDCWEEQCRN